ncbi:MAG: cell division protein FtsQ [Verrucomicrobiota bacterium]|jgi:cell division protein FtsQ|nr:cell division protein FtsQ [Verrucomicrobiota bacterium]MDK2964347.1 cell division protein FtsQ [Verrucomicrobiota bacterium]
MVAKRRKKSRGKIHYSKNRSSKKVAIRRSLIVVLFVAVALPILFGIYKGLAYTGSFFFSRNPYFELRQLKISSDGRLSPSQLREYTGIQIGENLFSISPDDLRGKLKQVPLIESIGIQRKLPNTLVINVRERVAVAQIRWNSRSRPFLVDRHGVVLPVTRSGQSLPIIEGLKLDQLKPGDRIEKPGVSQCLELLASVDQLGLGSQVSFSGFDVRYPDFVTATVNGETTVRFPQHSAREKLIRLVRVLQLAKEQGHRVKTIDLTPDGRNVPVTYY